LTTVRVRTAAASILPKEGGERKKCPLIYRRDREGRPNRSKRGGGCGGKKAFHSRKRVGEKGSSFGREGSQFWTVRERFFRRKKKAAPYSNCPALLLEACKREEGKDA